MITKQILNERRRAYREQVSKLGFKGSHKPRTPEKEKSLFLAAIAFLSKFKWVRGEDGVLRKRPVETTREA
jgi:hypothetical protein